MKTYCIFLWLLVSATAKSQDSSQMRYVDFHLHSTLKNYYRNVTSPLDMQSASFIAAHKEANWNSGVPHGKIKDTTGFSPVYGKASYDQATFQQLSNSHAYIICTSLYSLEKQSISRRKVPFTHLLGDKNALWFRNLFIPAIIEEILSMRVLNRLAVTHIKVKRMKTAFDPGNSNFNEFTSELKFLDAQQNNYPGFRRVQVAKTKSDFDDTTKVWLVLTAEGAHNFYGDSTSSLNDIMSFPCPGGCQSQIIHNLDSIKRATRLFFVGPAHLFENKVSGGARGLDMDKPFFRLLLSRLMWSRAFSVVDNKAIEGINQFFQKNSDFTDPEKPCDCNREGDTTKVDIGWAFIKKALDTNDRVKRTYIDMRHMDVKARTEYIDFIEKHNAASPSDNIPLIVSHGAVSGKNLKMSKYLGLCPVFDDYKEFIDPYAFYKKRMDLFPPNKKDENCLCVMGLAGEQGIKAFLNGAGWFHPMSNNLYDEEIAAVYKSDGIIGITMEERALGRNTYNYRHPPDSTLRQFLEKKYGKAYTNNTQLINDWESTEPFVRNLFYIVEHSGFVNNPDPTEKLKAWMHIGIGSDFDGMMNPINICPTATQIPYFYQFLCDHLADYACYLKKTSLLMEQTPPFLLSRLFYKNGEDFIKKYF